MSTTALADVNLRLFEIMNVGFEGTMRGIFSMMFGAGLVLLTERIERAGARVSTADIHFRRMSWLGVFGFIHWSFQLWPDEILIPYAICGFGLFVLRKLPARWQFGIGLAILMLAAVKLGKGYFGTGGGGLCHRHSAWHLRAWPAAGGRYGPVASAAAGRTCQISRLAMVFGHLGLVM